MAPRIGIFAHFSSGQGSESNLRDFLRLPGAASGEASIQARLCHESQSEAASANIAHQIERTGDE
jgi:hypothetical protein